MKNLVIFGLFVLALIVVQFAHAQTVEDIVDRYIAAMGGKEKLLSLKTIKMEGTMNTQGVDVTITNTKSHLTGMRLDFEVMGTSNYQIVNTTKGSSFWPVRGKDAPEDMEDAQYKSAINQLDIQGALVDFKEKGNQIEMLGKETEAGSEVNKLKVTYRNGVTSTFFMDAKSGRLLKTEGKLNMNGQEMEIVTSYSDYRQNADGFWFAYSVTTQQGEIKYDKISTNIPVDDNLFKN